MKKSGDRSTPSVSQTNTTTGSTHTIHIQAERELLQRFHDEQEYAAKLVSRRFGAYSVGDIPPLDAVVMGRLREALTLIDEDLRVACFQRGLLSRDLSESLTVICFLSFTLPSARAAQDETGVPASLLIAEAYHTSLSCFFGNHFEWDGHVNDVFAVGKKFPTLRAAFTEHAHSLKKQKRFQPVLRASGQSEYLEQVALWSASKHNRELVDVISTHGLIECDSLHL